MNQQILISSVHGPDHPANASQADDALIRMDRQLLCTHFNKHPFLFEHELADPPLFRNQRLLALARSLPARDVSLNHGDVSIGDNWKATTSTLEEAIGQVDRSDAYVVLKRVERDPEFRVLLERGIRDIEQSLQRDIRGIASQIEAFIFIASPGAVTPFHIDAECTFLFQIRGEKTFYVCDPEDRDMLPREEVERFYWGSADAATYKPEHSSNARVYRLGPGMSVHLPVQAAHWVKNDDNVSVALSISFVLSGEHARRVAGGAAEKALVLRCSRR